jgi:DnaJ-class molecular chaperone
MSEAAICPHCKGIGQKVKRVTYRPSGTISSIVYDLKANCEPCRGIGLTIEKREPTCS